MPHADIWLAGVLDTSGCWSCQIAGKTGRSVGGLRLQVAGPPELVAAILAAAECGGINAGRSWSLDSGPAIDALLRRIRPHARVRGPLYRLLLAWPHLRPGQHATPAQGELRRQIALDLGLIDHASGRAKARTPRRRKTLSRIRRKA